MTALLLVGVSLLASAVLGRLGPRVSRRLPPATAVRLLTAAALVTALATGFVLSVTAFTALARVPGVAAMGHWSTAALGAHDYVPWAAGAAATAAVVSLLALALRYAVTATVDLVTAEAACRRLGPGAGALVVVQDDQPDAYVVPGVHGRMVVSTAMLAALPADERRALLAHEQAHLRHRHHLYIQLTELGARANPLLRPLVAHVGTGVERWADEEAALVTGDRVTTARAIARAAVARHDALSATDAAAGRRLHRLALGIATAATLHRTRALLAEPVPRRTAATVALTALVGVSPMAALASALVTEHCFELAQAALLARG